MKSYSPLRNKNIINLTRDYCRFPNRNGLFDNFPQWAINKVVVHFNTLPRELRVLSFVRNDLKSFEKSEKLFDFRCLNVYNSNRNNKYER